MPTPHPHVPIVVVIHDEDHTILVDEEIAELIKLCFALDCHTLMSCQDNHGKVWLDFATGQDAENFINLVGRFQPNGEMESGVEGSVWEYEVHVTDVDFVIEDDGEALYGHKPEYIITVSVRFPRDQLEAVVRALCGVEIEPDTPVNATPQSWVPDDISSLG